MHQHSKPLIILFLLLLFLVILTSANVSAATFESSQYRIETINDHSFPRQSNQNSFANQGYVLTEISAIAPFDLKNPSSFTISPQIVKLLVKRGAAVSVNFHLENRGDPELISLKIVTLETGEHTTPLQFKTRPPFFLTKGPAKAKVEIAVGTEISEQDYYYKVIFEKNIAKKTAQPTKEELSSILLITVVDNGQAETMAYLDTIAVSKSSRLRFWGREFRVLDSLSAVKAKVGLRNGGGNFFQTQGRMTIKKPHGREIVLGIKPTIVLAHRAIAINLPTIPLPIGRYQMIIGLNSAGADLNQKGETLSERIDFYILPIKLTVTAAIALMIFILFIKLKKKKSVKA